MCDHNHAGSCDDHSHDDEELGIQYSLYTKIDMDKLTCLNEETEGSGKSVFKPWDRRNDRYRNEFVCSDADAELLFNIPFTGNVKLKGIRLIGGETGSHPTSVKLYKNRPDMTFDDTSLEADQTLQLARDTDGSVEYPVKVVKFGSVSHLTMYFPANMGDADSTKIYYIGLRGEFSAAGRREAVICTYEASAVPQDHKGEIPEAAKHGVF